MPARTSLSGAWSGAYRYLGDIGPETVFNVRIEEVGGAFTGAVQEPNVLKRGSGSIVTAEIEGVRTAQTIAFTKFYNGSGGMSHAVRYEGEANAALTRIDGRWTIPRGVSGTFFMEREDEGAEAQAEALAEEQLVGRK